MHFHPFLTQKKTEVQKVNQSKVTQQGQAKNHAFSFSWSTVHKPSASASSRGLV